MPSSFAQFAIAPSLVERLHQTGKDIPTPVQERAIPALLQGRDVICRAQTGVGKTLSFVVPLFTKITEVKTFVQALILSPTRELAQQTAGEIKKLADGTPVRVLAVSGGKDYDEERRKLGNKANVLVGTPGRLLDHLRKGNTSLGGITYLVLDEVDEKNRELFLEDRRWAFPIVTHLHLAAARRVGRAQADSKKLHAVGKSEDCGDFGHRLLS